MNYRFFFLSVIVIVILNYLNLFEVLNNRIYDQYIILNQLKQKSDQIVIVEIDSKSIKKIGYWPWKRSIYEQFLTKIIEFDPAVIGIDLSFTETQGSPEEDNRLYDILKSFNNIVIVPKFKKDRLGLLIPEKSLFPDIKSAHVLFSEKEVIRSFPPFKIVPAFSLMLLKLYYYNNQADDLSPDLEKLLNQVGQIKYSTYSDILIDYKRTPGFFEHISFVDIINNNVSARQLKGKIVLIGVTDKYLIPFFATPFTTQKQAFSSSTIELQAQIIDSLINYRGLQKIPEWLTDLLAILIAFIFFLSVKGKSFLFQGIIFIVVLLILCLTDYALFKYAHYWLPPSISLIMIFVIFGFHTYLTVTRVDTQLIQAIDRLHDDENIPLKDIPSDITRKVNVLNSFMKIIINDRKTIKAIINGVNNGIIVFSKEGRIIWSNARFLDLFKDTLVLNCLLTELIPDININEMIEILMKEKLFRKEISLQGKDFLCTINPIDNENNEFIAILNDVTELKEIDRLKTDMIRMVSHELKVPLMNIMLASEEIEVSEEKNRILKNNTVISNAATTMVDTINNFLNLNKLESGLMQVNLSSFDLNEIIERCIDFQSTITSQNNINIIFKKQELPPVLMDHLLIDIVMNNLLSNAIKYSKPDSNVVIKVKQVNNFVKTSVIDYGVGIAQEEIDLIQNKFYRAKNNEKFKIKGTGLGLSIVSKILALHQSSLIIESEENKGSAFSFSLPVSV